MKEFDHFLDVAAMQSIFQQHLPGICDGPLQIIDCQLLHSHFYTSVKHPQKSRLGLCYQLRGVDRTTQLPWQQIFYAKARIDGQSAADFAAAQLGELWQPNVGKAVSHLPEHDLTVWAFPNDPQLPHLPQVIDLQRLKQHLPYAALPTALRSAQAIQCITSDVIHYYPEERCTTRYELHGSAQGKPVMCVLFGKTLKDCSGKAIYQRLCEAWQYAQASPSHFRVAQPLGYSEEIHTIWLRGEAGKPLAQAITAMNAAPLLLRVAQGLAKLQCSDLPATGEMTMRQLLGELEEKVQKLAHALPDLADQLHDRLTELREAMSHLPPGEARLIHGDFHIRQLLVEGNGDERNQGRRSGGDDSAIIFLDFDEFAVGDPLRDVANFVVDLHYAAFDPDFVRLLTHCFIESYRSVVDFVICPARLQWHLRYLFMTKAYRAYRQHKADLDQVVVHSFALADALCADIR